MKACAAAVLFFLITWLSLGPSEPSQLRMRTISLSIGRLACSNSDMARFGHLVVRIRGDEGIQIRARSCRKGVEWS